MLRVVLLAALGWTLARGRTVTRCELRAEVNNTVGQLLSNTSMNGSRSDGFRHMMAAKVACLADTVSGLSTGPQSVEGNYTTIGLFRLSIFRFCEDGSSPTENLCQTNCSYLLDDDIGDDVKCLLDVSTGSGPVEIRLLMKMLDISRRSGADCDDLQPLDYFADCD